MKSITENPWAGLAAYQDPETSPSPLKFCGRDNDAYDITQLTHDNLFVTLYGKSGVGKTSLLNAGVFPRLRSMGYLPMNIRLGIESDGVSFQECIISKLSATLEERGCNTISFDVTPLPSNEQSQEYLWSYFARNHFIDKDNHPVFPVFVLDQFEEVFKNRKNDAEALLRQLNYLMDESHALIDRMVDSQYYTYDYNYRFVLSIREDDLYRLEDSIDNNYLIAMKRCRYRLRGLTEEGAREAILLPGEGLFDENEREQIVNDIINTSRNSDDNSISTNVLSLICSRLYLESRKSGHQQISALLVSTYLAGNPFEKYYYEATSGFSNKEKSYIERHLIDSTGRRNSISESDFFLHVKNGESLLEGPQKILQRVSVSSDSKDNRIELIHDSFCTPLVELRAKRLQRRRRRMMMVSLAFALLCIGIAITIQYQLYQVELLNRTMLENNSRFVSEKASDLVDNGDSYTARKLALYILENRPYVIEAEAALRKASVHNSAVLRGHKDCLCFVSFSDDGGKVISISKDSTAITWDANDGKIISTESAIPVSKDYTTAITFDGKYKARVCKDNTEIEIIDTKSGRIKHKLTKHEGAVNAIMFSPNGKLLASASNDNTIRIWDVESGWGKRTFEGHSNDVTCLSFSPDGKRLVSGSDDHNVRLWDVYGYNADWIYLDLPNYAVSTFRESSFSQNGKYLASIINGDVFVWETESGKQLFSYQGENTKTIRRVSFYSPREDNLILASGKILYFWNAKQNIVSDSLVGHKKPITSINTDNKGEKIVSSSMDATAIIWDAQAKNQIQLLSGHDSIINYATFNHNADLVATASKDKTVKIWDAKTGNCLHTLRGHKKPVESVDFSPNGKYLASTSENAIKIWDIQKHECIKTIEDSHGDLFSVRFYSDSILISASSIPGLVKAWNIPTCTLLYSYGTDVGSNEIRGILPLLVKKTILSVSNNGIFEKWLFPSLEELIQECQKKISNIQLSSEDKRIYYLE